MNNLNLLEESATGEKMTSWTVYSVDRLVIIRQVHTEVTQKHSWPENGTKESMAAYSGFTVRDSSIARYKKFCRKMDLRGALATFQM